MQRRIVDYGVDEAGERIAILDCGHPQHIRHSPPFTNRPWTLTEEGRQAMMGQWLNCVRCEPPGAGDCWRSLSLGDALIADKSVDEVAERARCAFDAAGAPAEMAVFKRHHTEHSLHCEITVYFSPAAAVLAHAFSARACPRPSRANLDLLAGDRRAWRMLFD